jgi:hypothetical protein
LSNANESKKKQKKKKNHQTGDALEPENACFLGLKYNYIHTGLFIIDFHGLKGYGILFRRRSTEKKKKKKKKKSGDSSVFSQVPRQQQTLCKNRQIAQCHTATLPHFHIDTLPNCGEIAKIATLQKKHTANKNTTSRLSPNGSNAENHLFITVTLFCHTVLPHCQIAK